MRLCRSLVNARGASYSLVFRNTEDVIYSTTTTTIIVNNTLRAQRNICQDNEEQLLPILFDIPAEGRGQFMTTAQISERLVSYCNIKKPMSVSQLGMLLGRHGYRAVTRDGRNTRVRGWIVYQRDTEEINANKRLIDQECVTV